MKRWRFCFRDVCKSLFSFYTVQHKPSKVYMCERFYVLLIVKDQITRMDTPYTITLYSAPVVVVSLLLIFIASLLPLKMTVVYQHTCLNVVLAPHYFLRVKELIDIFSNKVKSSVPPASSNSVCSWVDCSPLDVCELMKKREAPLCGICWCQSFILWVIVECKACQIPKALLICTEEIWGQIVIRRTLLVLYPCASAEGLLHYSNIKQLKPVVWRTTT